MCNFALEQFDLVLQISSFCTKIYVFCSSLERHSGSNKATVPGIFSTWFVYFIKRAYSLQEGYLVLNIAAQMTLKFD